jgi:hypothetical protein
MATAIPKVLHILTIGATKIGIQEPDRYTAIADIVVSRKQPLQTLLMNLAQLASSSSTPD